MQFSVPKPRILIWLFCGVSSLTRAQTIQNILWKVPDGNLSDLSQTFTAGTTLPLSWNAFPSIDYIDTTQNLVDLWVTSYDINLNQFFQSVTRNINLMSPGNYAWTIEIPDETLAKSAKYVLRFKPASPAYDVNSAELSSPGFLVLRAASSSSAVSNSSASTITTSGPLTSSTKSESIPTQATSLSSQTSTNKEPSSSGGLDNGSKAGIGVGVAVGALAIFGIIYFFFIRRSPGTATPSQVAEPSTTQETYKYGSVISPAELPEARHMPGHAAELPS